MTLIPMISVRAVSRDYGDGALSISALRGIDLEISAGTVTALFGKSGSGKTTLLNCIAGLDRQTEGTVEVDGVVIEDLSVEHAARWRRENLGFVYQANGLLPWLTATQNVEVPLRVAGEKRRVRAAMAQESLDRVGLGGWADHYPGQLSGGQQQRVAVARAIIARPPLILADEPTGSLDEATGLEILQLLAAMTSDGCTVVIATHDQAAHQVADRVVELRDGLAGRPL